MLLQAAFAISASFSHAALRQACVTAVCQQPEPRAAVSAAADARNRRLVGRRLGGRVSRKQAVADLPKGYMYGFTRGDVWATCDVLVEGIVIVKRHSKGTLLGPHDQKGEPTKLWVKFEHLADSIRADSIRAPGRKFGEIIVKPDKLTSSEPPLLATPDLAYGMQLKLQHKRTGCRLHSHDCRYPGGSRQQQVTGFYGEDDNDWWRIKAAHGAAEPLAGTHVKDGDVIRLQHVATGRNLHSHSIASPVTNQQEVSAFGTGGHGDANCNWCLRLGQDDHGAIRLQHVNTGHGADHHYLHSHGRMLPSGYGTGYGQGPGQGEVTVSDRWNNRDDLWRVQRFRMPKPLVEVVPLAAPTGNAGFFAAIDDWRLLVGLLSRTVAIGCMLLLRSCVS